MSIISAGFILFLALISSQGLAGNSTTTTGKKIMSKEPVWYQGNCTSAQIVVVNKKGEKRVTEITDHKVISKITALLDKLPTKGDIMISMAPTTVTSLVLNCDGSSYTINYFGNKIKAPDTSFFAGKKPEETELFDLLNKYY